MNPRKNKRRVLGRFALIFLISILINIGVMTSLVMAQQDPDEENPNPDIPPGYIIIEGDIVVPDQGFLPNSTTSVWNTQFWTNGRVPFIFDANVTVVSQTLMIAAMAEWENVANVDFVPRNGEANYIRIQHSTGNNSMVGMQGGEQIVNIFSWGWRYIMAHELAHAVGFWHEQSRPDRNSYIQVNNANISPTSAITRNFSMSEHADVYPKQVYGLADEETYDFDSVMHYGQCAFDRFTCPPSTTITVLSPNQSWQTKIGQRAHLSGIDRLTMSFLYAEDDWFFLDKSSTESTADGNFITPYKNMSSVNTNLPNNSTLWIQPGSYSAVGTYSKPMTWDAPLGHVILGGS